MASFWLLLLLSMVNVALGYALAVYLGYAPPSLRDAWVALGGGPGPPHVPATAPIPAVIPPSRDIAAPQDALPEADPVGHAAEESHPSRIGIEMPNASVECGGGAT